MLPLAFCCRTDNDLYSAFPSETRECLRFDTADEGFNSVRASGGLLVLADGYPESTTEVDDKLVKRAAEKDVRIYVEYPRRLPALKPGKPRRAEWERGVIASDAFGPSLQRLRILDLHGCHFLPMEADHPLMVMGRVAGLDTAVFGIPDEALPVLFKHPELDVLVAATKLSQFITARYGPAAAWRAVWNMILGWLTRGNQTPSLDWVPTVRPSFDREESLPDDVELRALQRGLVWFQNSGLLVGSPGKDRAGGEEGGIGEGANGLMEGFGSLINHDGSQPIRGTLRSDCIGEGAGALSFGRSIRRNHFGPRVAENLVDYVFFHSVFAQGPRADPESPSYGLLSWTSSPPSDSVYYGDDNARCLLGVIASIAQLGSDRWNKPLLRSLLANLRTTGRNGFRGWRLEDPELQKKGWRHFHNRDNVLYAPHYEAYLWACFLWTHRQTGYRPFLSKPRKAIRMTMKAYPDEWRWTNGIAQERARMLLPLAWLVRAEDTPRHRRWLRRMGEEVVALQDACGALREELGGPGMGSYGPPNSNEDYGRHEATLLHENGDPICDMLYTSNFAFLGLHEAAAATGEELFIRAEDGLAEFLCRIQIRSQRHPELDGAWYRGFDFKRWDYWGSNADAGWGVWSIESGWTQGWIVSVLGLRQMKTSLWDLSAGIEIKGHLKELVGTML